MPEGRSDQYVELAELARANVAGPVGREIVASAQKRLLEKMKANGTLSQEDADALSM